MFNDCFDKHFIKLYFRTGRQTYGVERIYGLIELAEFKDTFKNETITVKSYLDVDTGDRKKTMFHVPMNYSYLCKDIGQLLMETHLHFSYPDWPKSGTNLRNATDASLKNVNFDAFRPKGAPPLQVSKTRIDLC